MRHLLPTAGTVVSAGPATKHIASVTVNRAQLQPVSLRYRSSKLVLDFYSSATMAATPLDVESVSVMANEASKLDRGRWELVAVSLIKRPKVSNLISQLFLLAHFPSFAIFSPFHTLMLISHSG